jgi:hypothetical protein
MITKTIKYTDFNGIEREEKYLFNLTKAELMEMELGTTGGLTETIQKIINEQDAPKIQEYFKNLLLKSYGEKSDDGKKFLKLDKDGRPLSIEFSQSAAFSELYMELATNSEKATEFIKGIMPSDLDLSNVDVNAIDVNNIEETTKALKETNKK